LRRRCRYPPPVFFADVVRTRQQYDHLRIDAIEFPVFDPPQHILDAIRAPPKIRRIPSEEVLFPAIEQLRIIGGAPAARDGITSK
jgi:hypothetical protein